MIDGITVLNQTKICEFNIGLFIFLSLFFIIIGILASIHFKNELVLLAIGALGIVFVAVPTASIFTIEGYTQYECLIDDSVSFAEVYDKYIVVEQRGDIWVLEDKE